jgi:pseudaminic acid synthase
LQEIFQTIVVYQDIHLKGISVRITAVALGAKIIENSFLSLVELGGPDSSFSLEPEEFKIWLMKCVMLAEKSSWEVRYDLTKQLLKVGNFSRSLFIVKCLKERQKS